MTAADFIKLVRGLTRRLEKSELRVQSLEYTVKAQAEILNLLRSNTNAQLAVAGSPALQHEDLAVVKVTGKHPDLEHVYTAVRRIPSDLRTWQDDPEDADEIYVCTLPAEGDGDGTGELESLIVGEHYYVRWDGRDDENEFYHVVGPVEPRVRQFRFKSASQDYWICRTWDGETEGSVDVFVAKPRELRRSLDAIYWPGVTMTYTSNTTRTATQADVIEDHVLIPPMPVNTIIEAATPIGGTGVTDVVWQDRNIAGRAWAMEPEE